ncbi:hypothetical protein SLEP1_g51161 [Rubroshorea leprosula]|uniref:Transposase n=1 Tax=Rubroshorea leprosula TaxID=152421 RepID=A0AAV5M2A2_9ROSI|nr:hypothetical protein SLEP1_g51161 [Rubroshorea leprosula]
MQIEENNGDFLPMLIHIGGTLIRDNNGNLQYVDGECERWKVNPNLLTMWEFYEKVKFGRYDVEEVLNVLKENGNVHIYVSYIPNFAEIVEVLMLPAPSEHMEPIFVVDVIKMVLMGSLLMLVGVGLMRMRWYEGGLEDVPEWSDNDDDETVLARDNLRNFRANQIGVASSFAATGNVDVGDQDEDAGEIQSNDEVSYISTSNEKDEEADHGRRRKARHKVFKEVDGIPKIELGMIFLNKKQFKKAVDQLSIKQRREITWKKNDSKRMKAALNVTNKVCTSSIAAQHLVKTKEVASLCFNKDDIFIEIKNDLGVELTLVQCKKTKMKLKKTFDCFVEAEYKVLFDSTNELRSKDLEANIVLERARPTTDMNPVFLRMYVYFSALKKGFISGCRHIIGVDGAFLKGAHKGELLTTVGRDANEQMFPIASVVVEVETRET